MTKASLLLCAATCVASSLQAQIALDQQFDDWAAIPVVGLQESNAHARQAQVTSNSAWVFWRLGLEVEIALDETIVPHGLQLWVDNDANVNTGWLQPGIGVDVLFDFAEGEVKRYNATGIETVLGFNDVGFHVAPTYSGDDLEMAVDRDMAGIDGNAVRWQWVDTMHDEVLPANPELTPLSGTAPEYTPIPLERAAGTQLRTMWWNVNRRMDLSGAAAAMGRMVAAIQPDVIGLSEVDDVSAPYVKSLLESWLPGTTWNVVKDDYDLMVASTYPLGEDFPDVYRSFPVVVDTEALYGKPTLFTSSHLKCCGGATNEAKRQAEADEFMAFHRDAMQPGGELTLPEGSPFIFGGDLNMVGLGDPIVTLQTGDIHDEATYGEDFAPDWDGTGLLELPILQADRPMDYTWRNDNSDYAPGKLDYAIVSDGVVQVLRSYGLQTQDMSGERLGDYGLLATDTWVASDHLPIVVDLALIGSQAMDSDLDGVPDAWDNCLDLTNPAQADFNGNGVGDACEDSDQDGLWDAEELDMGLDPTVQDSDGDGLTDGAEVELFGTDPLSADSDGDGIDDALELLFPPTSACPGDLNGDASVNVQDLLLLLGTFGLVC